MFYCFSYLDSVDSQPSEKKQKCSNDEGDILKLLEIQF